MAAGTKREIHLEIAHVLFMDIVGYSKRLIDEQRRLLDTLNQIVRNSETFREADGAGKLIKIPRGDGMALVFRDPPEAPVECAIEISRVLKEHPELPLRIGVHSGPVSGVIDVNERANVTGGGINMAQRVMNCGDGGHILLSKHVAEDLEESAYWKPHLHDLGEVEVKHGVRVGVVNLYSAEFGNARMPKKLEALRRHRAKIRWTAAAVALLGSAAIAAGLVFFAKRSTPPLLEKSIAVLPFANLSRDPDN